MSRIRVPIVVGEGATQPAYATPGSAGVDLCSTAELTLEPMTRALIPTGIRVAIPHGFEGQIRPRSGMAIRQGLSMVNSPGTIDSDYRGEIQVIAINLGQEPIHIAPGDRIAQMVFCPVVQADFEVMDSLDETDRGEGGFGSTGKR
jgi:dUTP pyrophosphatase